MTAEDFVRLRKSEDSKEYFVAANAVASVATWINVISRYPDMREWVAHNKTIPEEIIKLLAADPDPRVRHMIASKNRTPTALLEKLSKDPDETVRFRVAVNRKTPDSILEKMLNDPWSRVVEEVKNRLSRK